MAQSYTNRFGRKGGRGLRPWFLLPKVVTVAVFLGAMAAVVVLCLTPGKSPEPADRPAGGAAIVATDAASGGHGGVAIGQRNLIEADRLQQVSALYRWLIIPASTLAMILGVILLVLDQPRILLGLRWLQLKLALLAVSLPVMHLGSLLLMRTWRQAVEENTMPMETYRHAFGWSTLAMTVVLVAVTLISRHKPRLGQVRGRRAGVGPSAGTKSAGLILILALTTTTGLLSGCRSTDGFADLSSESVPPDFSLVMMIRGPADADDPVRRPAQYVLDPARRLRAAVGPAAVEGLSPPVIRTLSPRDRDAVWAIFVRSGLADRMDRDNAPGGRTADRADNDRAQRDIPPQDSERLTLRVQAFGETRIITTSWDGDPDVVDIARVLVRLTRGLPPRPIDLPGA
ncbi:MAG: hypothetical protein JJU36_01750 [Phycisphaeraceae bacterium]|nr:hypothetical protein [Phycisphaeraceae bacterium]